MISENIAVINERLKKAAQKVGRGPQDVKVVCVTKGRGVEEIIEAINCGIKDIGENRVQEAVAKQKEMDARFPRFRGDGHDSGAEHLSQLSWHMIGHLQTNKVRDAVRICDLIHSVGSLKLAKEIDKEAVRQNKVQEILIEVNTSGEETKFGVKPDGLMNLIKELIVLKNIRLSGLMTIAPIVKDKEATRPYFRKLRELKDEANETILLDRRDILVPSDGGVEKPRLSKCYGALPILSMGMSQDYEVAIEEGATMVRIGTAIFGI